MKKILLLLVLLCLPYTKVNAFYCTYQEQARLKSLATNVNISYDFNESNKTFTFNLINLNKDLYFMDRTDDKIYNYTKNEINLTGYKSGQKVKFEFYSDVEFCDKVLYTYVVTLPIYNPYYKEKVCEDVQNYNLCQKWSNHGLSRTAFIEKVNEYKKTLEKPKEDEIKEETKKHISLLTNVIEFLTSYYYIFIILIVGIIVTVIIVNNKKSNIYK